MSSYIIVIIVMFTVSYCEYYYITKIQVMLITIRTEGGGGGERLPLF